ncbi:pectinesterase family protein [Parasediminibacterium paludis]|uniref:Pectinesterase family protein n=1 Tax=Parasediminibacterium paludis TaxID=908966 RepID=A0ABV8PSX7_9BACT
MKTFITSASKALFCLFFATMFAQIANAQYNKTVAKDGSGDFTTLQAAIDAAPTTATAASPWVIYIRNGKYREKINIPSTKPYIQIVGESVANVFVYYDDPATILGTQNSASFTINASDFTAVNITFANTFGDGSQAVAVLVNADRVAFKNCRLMANQDTLYVKGSGVPRSYFKNCYIDGNIDFIFGSSVAVFDSCVVYAKSKTGTGASFMTAANTPAGQAYGFTFRGCVIPANTGGTSYYLGRPWPSPSEALTNQKTIYLNCTLPYTVNPAGWSTWDANTITSNITYAEFQSKKTDGSAADVSQRVSWSKQFSATDTIGYNLPNMLSGWDPNTTRADFATYVPSPIAVANFTGIKGTSTSVFNWNISWPMTAIKYELFRSSDKVAFTKVNEQTSVNDTAVNFTYSESIPPPGQTYYYYIIASKTGYASHTTDTVAISSTPTIVTTGTLGSFSQGVGIPSNTQAFVASGTSLTNDIVITAPANFEISSNGGATWNNSSTPLTLTQTSGNVSNTTISVRLNGTTAGSYSGNITLTSTGAASVTVPVTGIVQATPLTVSTILEYWPLTTNNQDSAAVRATGIVATTPTLNKLVTADGSVSGVTAYSATYGQAYAASAAGSWTTGSGGPGGNLNRTNYEEFTVTAAAGYTVRLDSIILNNSFYNTSSNTKLAIVYSKTAFTTADSTDVPGAAFGTPLSLINETSGTNANFRLAVNGATGITILSGQTLNFRIYNSCGSSNTGRYGKLKNVYVVGLSTLNPVAGDFQSHQSGDWTNLATWERYDGTNWVTPAPAYPVYNNSGITSILSGHTVTISATLANGSGYIHLTKVKQGGQLIVSAGANLNIANDGAPSTATTDLQIDGTMTVAGSMGTNGNVSTVINGTFVYAGTGFNFSNAGDSVFVNNGATYQHNANSNLTPNVMKCQAGATLSITGITSNQTGIFKTTSIYGNIIWNCPSQANYYAFRNTLNATNVLGSFTVANTGTTYISFVNATGKVNFPGGFYQTGGTVNFRESGTIIDTLATASDFNISGGTFLSNMGTGTNLDVELNGVSKVINYAGTNANNTKFNVNGNYSLTSNLTLPNAGFGVVVNGSLNLNTSVISGSGDVTVSNGASITTAALSGLNGNITNSGLKSLSTTANYIFNGSAAQVTGTLLPAIVNALTINNASGVALSSSTAVVGGVLTLTSGNLQLGSSTLSTSSIVGASATNYIITDGTGGIKLNNVATGSNIFPVGTSATSYNPVTINNSGTANNITVSVKNTFDNAVPSATQVVNKQWTITPDATGSNIAATFSWLTADQASGFNPASAISVIRYNGTTWVGNNATITGSGVSATPYVASASGITDFGTFTVINTSVLPLVLQSFNAALDIDRVNLTWVTSNEINTQSFEIDKSTDANNFYPIGVVNSNNSSAINTYGFTDMSPLDGVSYYRLKMIDKNGTFTYSKTVSVTKQLSVKLSTYPNPVINILNIAHSKASKNASLKVISLNGSILISKQLLAGTTQTFIDFSRFISGSYLIVFDDNEIHEVSRFIKL